MRGRERSKQFIWLEKKEGKGGGDEWINKWNGLFGDKNMEVMCTYSEVRGSPIPTIYSIIIING